jgi:hypothetical protein
MTFGVPVDTFPITSRGELKTGNHHKWIAKRQVKESHVLLGKIFDRIDFPAVNDVLVGKGKPFQQHPGNIHLRSSVDHHLKEYALSKKVDKAGLIWKVVHSVKATSGGFLKKDRDGWWVEVTEEEAREKVAKIFTSAKAATKNQQPLPAAPKRQRIHDERSCFGFCE